MKMKKVWSGILAAAMALSSLSGGAIGAAAEEKAVVTLDAGTSAARYSYIDYTLGALKAGGYQGYAFMADYDYADKAAMDADELFTANKVDGCDNVEEVGGKGKPVLFDNGVKNQTFLTQNYPEKDENNVAYPPDGVFSILRYTEADSDVEIYDIRAGTHLIRKNGTFIYQKREGSAVEKPDVKGIALNDNDIVSVKAYRDETNPKAATATLWMANETADSGFLLQEKDMSPYYPKPAEKGYLSIRHQHGGSETAKETWLSSEAYEKEEFILRQAIAVTEDKMIESGLTADEASLLAVAPETAALTLADVVEGLDLDNKVSVAWNSDQKSIIADDGTIQYPANDVSATLTATYTLLDQETSQPDASKQKTIEYSMLVPGTGKENEAESLAAAMSWSDISNGQAAGAVREDLNFILEYSNSDVTQNAASLEWSVVSGGNVVDKNGNIMRDSLMDVSASVKAVFTVGDDSAEKVFDFTVCKTVSERDEAKSVADRITWEALSSENASNVTQSFELPMNDVTIEGRTVEIGWAVTAGSAVVKIENGKAVVTPDASVDVDAQLTATVTVGAATETREFNFIVVTVSADAVMEYYHMDFTKPGAAAEYAELVGEPVIAGSVGAGATAKFVEGQGLQMQTAGAGDGDNLSVTLNLKGAVSDVEGFQKLKTVNTTELTFEIAQNSGTLAPKTNFIFQDENGAAFSKASVVPTKIGFGPNNGFLSATLTNSVPWTADSSYNKLYKNGGNRITVSMQISFDNMTNELKIFAKLPDYVGDKGYDEYIQLVPDEKLMVIDADTKQNICRLQIMSMGNNIANIKSIRSYTSISAIKSVTDSQVRGIAWLNGQDPDFVISDLKLPSAIEQYGASLRWEIAPAGVFDETGKLIKTDLDGHNDVQVTVCPVVTFQNDAYTAATPVFNPTTITVTGYNRNNLARGKKVTLSGATAAEGSQAGNITDGNMRSALITTGGEDGLEAVIDLGALTWVNKVRLTEGEQKNIAKYEVSISKNKKEWQSAGIVTDLNDTEVVSFADDAYRYVKLQVLEKKNAALPVTIAEFEVEYTPSEDFKHKNDIETVKVPDGVITGDFELMAVGEAYGSPIQWTTSKPEILEITGPADRKYIVKLHKPEKSTVVSLTATIGDYNCSVQRSVQGTGGNGGGSGSGGSGGGGGKVGGIIGYIPPVSTPSGGGETETKSSIHFSDVTQAYEWAAGSIDALYEKGIINGLDDGSFAPDVLVTRAEYVKMLTVALGIEPKADAALPFADTAQEDWAYPYIAAAYEMGLVQGISETEFGRDQPITRQDIAVLTVRALEAAGKKIEKKAEAARFADEANIADYAVESIRRMQEGGILSGTPEGEFCPERAATRAESAKILYLTIN